MAREKPKNMGTPVITKRHAQGIRRQGGRDYAERAQAFVGEIHRDGAVSLLNWLRRNGSLAAQRLRPPSPGVPAGFDIVEVDTNLNSGEFAFDMQRLDKKGVPILKIPSDFLLRISKHASEALFQRLHTLDVAKVRAELKPVGAWLLENRAVVRMETKGYLLSPTGVFPIVLGEPFQDEHTDGRSHWVATTWIADTGLADDTEGKCRIAEVVQQARNRGIRVGLIPVGSRCPLTIRTDSKVGEMAGPRGSASI